MATHPTLYKIFNIHYIYYASCNCNFKETAASGGNIGIDDGCSVRPEGCFTVKGKNVLCFLFHSDRPSYNRPTSVCTCWDFFCVCVFFLPSGVVWGSAFPCSFFMLLYEKVKCPDPVWYLEDVLTTTCQQYLESAELILESSSTLFCVHKKANCRVKKRALLMTALLERRAREKQRLRRSMHLQF